MFELVSETFSDVLLGLFQVVRLGEERVGEVALSTERERSSSSFEEESSWVGKLRVPPF